MAKGKFHPTMTSIAEMVFNEDFYGAIRNPNDSAVKQAYVTGKQFVGSFESISSQSFRKERQQGAGLGQSLASFGGITKAPSYITNTWQQQRAQESARKVSLTQLQKHQ